MATSEESDLTMEEETCMQSIKELLKQISQKLDEREDRLTKLIEQMQELQSIIESPSPTPGGVSPTRKNEPTELAYVEQGPTKQETTPMSNTPNSASMASNPLTSGPIASGSGSNELEIVHSISAPDILSQGLNERSSFWSIDIRGDTDSLKLVSILDKKGGIEALRKITSQESKHSALENQSAPASVKSRTEESRSAASTIVTWETGDKEARCKALMSQEQPNSVSSAPKLSTWALLTSGVLGHGEQEFANSNRAPISRSRGCNDPMISWGINVSEGQEINVEASRQTLDENSKNLMVQLESSEVNFDSLYWDYEALKREIEVQFQDPMIIIYGCIHKIKDFGKFSIGKLQTPSAYQPFVEMPKERVMILIAFIEDKISISSEMRLIVRGGHGRSYSVIFDPGGIASWGCGIGEGSLIDMGDLSDQFESGVAAYDKGKKLLMLRFRKVQIASGVAAFIGGRINFVFDSGGGLVLLSVGALREMGATTTVFDLELLAWEGTTETTGNEIAHKSKLKMALLRNSSVAL